MAAIVECVRINRYPDGSYGVEFSDGNEISFPDLPALQRFGSDIESSETARVLLIRWWLARSADATNVNLVVGKRLTFDLSAASPIRVQ